MAGSVNKVILIGNLGRDPEVRSFQNGGKVCNLRIATSENWKDRNTGERREKTEWHSVAIFQEGLVRVAEQYLKKGSKVYIEGQLQTRKWQDQSGQDRYSTEVVLQGYGGTLTMLDGRDSGGGGGYGGGGGGQDMGYDSGPSMGYDSGPSGGGVRRQSGWRRWRWLPRFGRRNPVLIPMIPPELHIIGLVVALLALAYGAIFPRMEVKTLQRMAVVDLTLGIAALIIAGSVYFGSGQGFSLLVMEVPWWAFTITVTGLIEVPLFLWFCKKHDIDMGGGDDG